MRQLETESNFSFTVDYVSPNVSEWTKFLAVYKGEPDVRMLEIGSFEGRSTVWFLANALTHPAARIVCVDIFTEPARELRFDHNIRIAGAVDKVTKLKGCSEDLLGQLPRESFDMIYVDGSHVAVNVLFDAVSAWSLLKAGGVLIFDDYLWEMHKPPSQRPQQAIDLFLDSFEGRYELLSKAYQVILRKSAPTRAKLGIKDITMHDLRRTAGTYIDPGPSTSTENGAEAGSGAELAALGRSGSIRRGRATRAI